MVWPLAQYREVVDAAEGAARRAVTLDANSASAQFQLGNILQARGRHAEAEGAYREVLRLRNMASLPFEEVARQMGRTRGAVRVLWFRAIERLRRELKQEDLL